MIDLLAARDLRTRSNMIEYILTNWILKHESAFFEELERKRKAGIPGLDILAELGVIDPSITEKLRNMKASRPKKPPPKPPQDSA